MSRSERAVLQAHVRYSIWSVLSVASTGKILLAAILFAGFAALHKLKLP